MKRGSQPFRTQEQRLNHEWGWCDHVVTAYLISYAAAARVAFVRADVFPEAYHMEHMRTGTTTVLTASLCATRRP